MRGRASAGVKSRLAAQVEQFLYTIFATRAARQHPLFEHFKRYPENFTLMLNANISQIDFDILCKMNPDWLLPYQNDVLEEIKEHWTDEVALAIQIHCKVGHSHKYLDMIHVLSKILQHKDGQVGSERVVREREWPFCCPLAKEWMRCAWQLGRRVH
jgi:hypothetical protein